MLTIAITGGIASGKTTVANMFKEKGIAIIDMDIIAHLLVMPTKKAYQSIIQHFGQSILLEDNTINRRMLRENIFTNPSEKIWLENLLHPLIREQVRREVEQVKSAYCIIVIPLLTENYPYPGVDRVLVVDSSEQDQCKRAMLRDNMPQNLANEIITQQASREQRLKYADDIILNENNIQQLRQKVEQLHQYYLTLSNQHN
ncbi:MAG: dephospho-CoA kinase [Legionellales bacterium]|nr:dephospho-CoA kinase [Legionellales bacterium]|tara:strand:+ start:759 stop:1361 length:603 start_codon:yes stop_codon:yes gene_type:complete